MPKPLIPPGQRPRPPGQIDEILPIEPPATTGDLSVELPMAKATAYLGDLGASASAPAAATLVSSYASAVNATPTPNYYVSTSGSDSNPGTSSAAPWATMAKIYNGSPPYTPGMVIALKRGDVWNEQLYLPPVSGTAGNPITYCAYGSGALPIINGPGGTGFGLDANNLSYIVIANLQFQNWGNDGVMLAGNCVGVRFVNLVSRTNTRHGFCAEATIGVTNQSDIEYQNCEAYGNGNAGFIASTVSGGIKYYNCKSTYSGQGVASHGLSAYFASNVHWYGCEAAFTNIDPVTGNPNAFTSEGIGFAFDDESGSGSIEYCYSHDNQGQGIAGGHKANGNTISYNVVVNNRMAGIVVNGDVDGSDNILIYNNTIVGNTGDGIDILTPAVGTLIKNNIIANNTNIGILFSASGVSGYTVATNILYNNGATTSNVTGATGTITTNPTLDASYVPIAGSPAINAGLTLTNNLGLHSSSTWPLLPAVVAQSGAWEIGAYVYG